MSCLLSLCDCLPRPSLLLSKLLYSFGYTLALILAVVVRINGSGYFNIGDTAECTGTCWNVVAVYRVSLGLVLYHSFLSVCLLGVNSNHNVRARLQTRLWLLKFLLFSGTIVGCFFIPAQRLYPYWIAALTFSSIFILLQAMLLVAWIQDYSEHWIKKYDESGSGVYKLLIIGCAIIAYGGTIAMTVIDFIYWSITDLSAGGVSSGCRLNNFFIGFNLTLMVCVSAVALLPKIREATPQSGLLQAGAVSLYNTYLVSTTVLSDPFSCRGNSELPTGWYSVFLPLLGMIMTLISLVYTAYSTSSSPAFNRLQSPDSNTVTFFLDVGDTDEDPEEENIWYTWFHFTFVLASFYMSSVITNWVSLEQIAATATSTSFIDINSGYASAWVKITTSWANYVLYLWTLLAPVFFPDRSFR